jgi:hypothetical protein
MLDGLIESLRAWLEGLRAWLLSRGEFGWMHDWLAQADVSALWVIVVLIVVVLVLVVGFWPPLKEDAAKPAGEETREG